MNERSKMDKRQLWQSQNFLKNPEFVATLIDKTNINPFDTIVEIGPGKGIITRQLSKRAARVIAVEYDHELASRLKDELKNEHNIEIIKADFLRWNLPREQYKVFSNIPFNMTADIINKLLNRNNPPVATYIIMQDRAAERFMGSPVSKNSQMSILLQPFFEMGIVTRINRVYYYPVPNVNTVLAKFTRREKPLIEKGFSRLYRDFVVYGFNQWKPTILDSFSKIFTNKQMGIMNRKLKLEGEKPSELSLNQWLGMFDTFIKNVPDERKKLVWGSETKLKSQQARLQKQHRTRK